MRPVRNTSYALAAILLSFALSACSDGSDKTASNNGKASTQLSGAAAGAPVKWTGEREDIDMITDSQGERYAPTDVTVQRGDSLRFLLKSGVHNVHFLPAKNPPGAKLPPVGDYLQLPGQITGYLIDFPIGRYYFQCDIHVALGMVGRVTVEDSN
jgi:plastocyanin